MPTKPILNPPEWALPGNYTTGPFIGLPRRVPIAAGVANEGHRPGSAFPTTAEEWNDWLAMNSDLVRWLFAGSFLPLDEPRVVEGDVAGYVYAQKFVGEATSWPNEPGFDGTANGLAAFDAHAGALEVGYQFDDAGAGAFLRSSGSFTMFLLNTGSDPCLIGSAAGNYGIDFGSNGVQAAIHGDGSLTAPGVQGESGNNIGGVGILGNATNPSATGIRGESDAAADGFGKAVYGIAQGDGVGVYAEADDGYALVAEGGGNLPPFRIVGYNIDPAVGGNDGSVWYHNFRARFGERRNSINMYRHSSVSGSVSAQARGDGSFIVSNQTVVAVAVTLADHSPSANNGRVLLRATFRWQTIAVATDLLVEIIDDTNGNTALSVSWFSDGSAGTHQSSCSLSEYYIIPTLGATQFSLRITTGGLFNAQVTQPCLTVDGGF